MKVTIKNLQKKIPINPKRIKEAVRKTCSVEGVEKSCEINICFVDDKTIKELNLMYLGQNNSTDVLAFNLSEPKNTKSIIADIVISTDKAISNARIFETTPLYELYLYVVHGMLHILGYDDNSQRKKRIMRKKEEEILKLMSNVAICPSIELK